MSASNTDKITDVRNATRPNSARVTSGRSAAGATLACDNLSGWPTASKVHFVTYTVNSSSVPVAGTQLDCYGIVSGNNIGSLVVVDGTDTGNAIGDYVEMLPTAAWGQDLADALMVGHSRTGAHAILDFTNSTHSHANNAGGGQLNAANALTAATLTATQMKYGMVRNRQGGTTGSATWHTAGTSNTDTSTKNIFLQVGSAAASSGGDTTVTFPAAYTQVPVVFTQTSDATAVDGFVQITAVTTTTFTFKALKYDDTTRLTTNVSWLAIGE